jgi:hypothetical protein
VPIGSAERAVRPARMHAACAHRAGEHSAPGGGDEQAAEIADGGEGDRQLEHVDVGDRHESAARDAWRDRVVHRHRRLRTVVEGPDGCLSVLTSNRDGRGSPVPDDDGSAA